MVEQWSELTEYANYAISNHGRVMNTRTDLVKNPATNRQGILMVNFSHNGNQTVRSVALLVACEFLPRHPNPRFETPIHLDGDRQNCRVDNLAWRPRWYAVKYHQQFNEPTNHSPYRKVMETHSEVIYDNTWEAAIALGVIHNDVMLSAMNGDPALFGTYHFAYVDH